MGAIDASRGSCARDVLTYSGFTSKDPFPYPKSHLASSEAVVEDTGP